MAKRVLVLVLALMLVVSFAFAAKKALVHYHWTETIYDPINMNAKKMFEATHPDVEVKLLLLPDGDRINIIRTVLAANGNIDSFALSNGESAEFLGAGQMVPIDPQGLRQVERQGRRDHVEPRRHRDLRRHLGRPVLRRPLRAVQLRGVDQHRLHEGSGPEPDDGQAQDLGRLREGRPRSW